MLKNFSRFVGGVLVLTAIPLGALATENCAPQMREASLSAIFRVQAGAEMQSARLVVATDAGFDEPSAWITLNGATCQAACRVVAIERDFRHHPAALELNCQNPGLPSLKSHAVVFLPTRTAENPEAEASIRFGTWLTGYQTMALEVENDRLTPHGIPPRDPLAKPAKPVLASRIAR